MGRGWCGPVATCARKPEAQVSWEMSSARGACDPIARVYARHAASLCQSAGHMLRFAAPRSGAATAGDPRLVGVFELHMLLPIMLLDSVVSDCTILLTKPDRSV